MKQFNIPDLHLPFVIESITFYFKSIAPKFYLEEPVKIINFHTLMALATICFYYVRWLFENGLLWL
jgi:hypothetical protein